ncbi:phosphogluconate dehydrogenase (NAD(+)-dependent, decarboxylating) [Alkalicoccus chagannorensis]|uniref:phosphogluconate dehydrogenase (NAD(+)-dependent, decarboxylating) n=1 Tax=Alkalicoccus chagannorensis TaxID=427072 RepID=UPI00047AE59E|nr:decarboxylating 6-phosphogluconate dehydrogenase [Alkalicoccus chagannorensis]
MHIGLIGLGKMGYPLALNLLDHDHTVTGTDTAAENKSALEDAGGTSAASMKEVIASLPTPRVVWLMVPAGDITDQVIQEASALMEEGDILVDGGNSNYEVSMNHGIELKKKGIYFVDVGTSGGVDGARNGACMMVGGEEPAIAQLEQVLEDVTIDDGYLHAGPPGSGHFLKMIHNGIEYGMMQSIAEGFDILEKSPFDYNYESVAKVWNHGSVIRSWLMELTQEAFRKDERLENIRGVMNSSGEGKWTVETALNLQVPAPVISLSLMMRYRSLEDDTFTGKVVAALRNEFGGHDVVKK